jgi:hypothetical protein
LSSSPWRALSGAESSCSPERFRFSCAGDDGTDIALAGSLVLMRLPALWSSPVSTSSPASDVLQTISASKVNRGLASCGSSYTASSNRGMSRSWWFVFGAVTDRKLAVRRFENTGRLWGRRSRNVCQSLVSRRDLAIIPTAAANSLTAQTSHQLVADSAAVRRGASLMLRCLEEIKETGTVGQVQAQEVVSSEDSNSR